MKIDVAYPFSLSSLGCTIFLNSVSQVKCKNEISKYLVDMLPVVTKITVELKSLQPAPNYIA